MIKVYPWTVVKLDDNGHRVSVSEDKPVMPTPAYDVLLETEHLVVIRWNTPVVGEWIYVHRDLLQDLRDD